MLATQRGMLFVGLDISETLRARDAIILTIGLTGLGCLVVFAGLGMTQTDVLARSSKAGAERSCPVTSAPCQGLCLPLQF